MRRMKWAALVLGSCVLGVGCDSPKPALAPTKPAVVLVSNPITDEVTDFEEFTGRTDAVMTVEVRARVTGYLDKVNFEDGAEVDEGAQLFEIDPRPYKAELDRTEAAVVQAEAHVNRLDADFRRTQSLFNRGVMSKQDFDLAAGNFEEAKAAVGITKANRDLAKLNLSFTRVTAPIGGRLSRRMVDPGNLVKADDTSLTNIVTLDPLYVYFDVDERTLLRIRRLIEQGKMRSRNESEVQILVGLADEEGFPHKGTINFSENKVDPSTGTLRVRGSIQNPKPEGKRPRFLSPGLFARVRLPIGSPHRALMIPEQAVGTDQGRKFLFVVNDKNEVVRRPVKVGPFNEGMRVIEEGLQGGEKVVVSGLQRIRDGAKVEPKFADEGKKATASATPPATASATPSPSPAEAPAPPTPPGGAPSPVVASPSPTRVPPIPRPAAASSPVAGSLGVAAHGPSPVGGSRRGARGPGRDRKAQ